MLVFVRVSKGARTIFNYSLQELDLLSQLYGLFQKFIRFDNRFRDTLWADVDLDASFREVKNWLCLYIFRFWQVTASKRTK